MLICFLSMFLSGSLVFSIKRKHLLIMLLSLEFLVLSVYLMIFMFLGAVGGDYFFGMVFLTFSVCEGVVGLSLMVSLIRLYGNDYFNSFSVLW